MKKRRLGLTVTILSAAALSVLVIACRTTSTFDARTVELRQVQQVATAFNKVIDNAIARRSGLLNDDIDICPPQSTAITSISSSRVTRVVKVPTRPHDDIPVDFTVVQLQELRALFNLKVDEAFASRDSAARSEERR